jgi:hypothetical protein
MRYCVIRHPDVSAAGTCPESALSHHEARGWTRVSDWRSAPALFNLADYPAQQQPAAAQAPVEAPAPAKASISTKKAS